MSDIFFTGGPRSDDHPARDARRGRRTAQRVAAVTTCAAVTVGGLAACGTPGPVVAATPATGLSPSTDAAATPAPDATSGAAAPGTPATMPSADRGVRPPSAAAPSGPTAPSQNTAVGIRARLTAQPVAGTRTVRFAVAVSGQAAQPTSAVDGTAITNPEQLLQVNEIHFGDGAVNGTNPGGEATCGRPGPVRAVDFRTVFEHTYARPGTYTVTYTTSGCRSGSAEPVDTRATAVVTVSAAAPAVASSADLTLDRLSAPGAREVEFVASVRGSVPLTVDAVEGTLARTADVQGVRVDYGDGSTDGADPGTATCRPGTPIRPLEFSSVYRHTYSRPGTYTIRFTTAVCAAGAPAGTTKDLTRSLVVAVR